jgi:acyl-CoA thioester hydrolase
VQKSDFAFHFPFRVRYAEIDGQGVVFNAHYLTYFDTAITEYMRHIGFDYVGQVDRTGEDFHLVKSLVEYKAPIRFDAEIEVHVRAGRIGRTSLTFDLAIFPKDGDQLLATGEIVWVNTDQKTHKTVPVPEELIERINAATES